MLGSANLPMMRARKVHKGLGLPASHPRGNDSHMIYPAAWKWCVPFDIVEALAAKHLARAGHVLRIHKTVVVDITRGLTERRADDPECGIAGKFGKQVREVAFAYRN